MPVDTSEYLSRALLELGADQLGSGFLEFFHWSLLDALGQYGGGAFSGFLGDAVMGAGHVQCGRDRATGQYTFEATLRFATSCGLSPQDVRRLVRPEILGDCLDSVMAKLRDDFESDGGDGWQRVWRFDVSHRQRFLVGNCLRRLAFGCRPILPFCDRRLLEVVGGMPLESLLRRRAQIDLLVRRFPDLAALPLDRNSYDCAPVRFRSPLHAAWHQAVGRPLAGLRRLSDRMRGSESRFYFRTFDLQGPGWMAIRQAAEMHRSKAANLLDPRALDEILPPPVASVWARRRVAEVYGVKTLLGFLLWAGESL